MKFNIENGLNACKNNQIYWNNQIAQFNNIIKYNIYLFGQMKNANECLSVNYNSINSILAFILTVKDNANHLYFLQLNQIV